MDVVLTPDTEQVSEEFFKKICNSNELSERPTARSTVIIDGDSDASSKQIWIPKAICLISQINPYYDFFASVLVDLYYTVFHDFDCCESQQNQTFLLEQYVKQLVDGMPPNIKGLKMKFKVNSRALIQNEFYPSNYIELAIPSDNKLPYVNHKSFDRFFSMIKAEEIVALFTAMIEETKTILIVCEDHHDLIPTVMTLRDLIYPFEWCLPCIPYLVSNPDKPNLQGMDVINGIQSIIMGIHTTAFNDMKDKMEEDGEDLSNIIVLDLTYTYTNPKEQPLPSETTTGQGDDTYFQLTTNNTDMRSTQKDVLSESIRIEQQVQ